jgi:hypothetical protein
MRGPSVLVNLVACAALGIAVLVACSPAYPTCYRGEYQGCTCPNAEHGYQACNVTEDGFQQCICDGTTPGVDAGVEASAGGAYMTTCGLNDACVGEGVICFAFPSKGKVCTRKCAVASDCPAPSPGCTPNNGVCKAP